MEHIHCRLEYEADGDPNMKIKVNDRLIKKFKAKGDHTEFSFVSSYKKIYLKIEMTGKNEREVSKYFELKKIFLNDIDIKNMIWNTTQVPNVSEKIKKKYKWEGNLYIGHNGYIEYTFESPIIEFLFNYHQPKNKVSSGMETKDKNLLQDMKKYFEKIVNDSRAKT